MKYHIYDAHGEMVTWRGVVLEFDTAESAKRYAEFNSKLYNGYRPTKEIYQSVYCGNADTMNATHLIPVHIDGRNKLKEVD